MTDKINMEDFQKSLSFEEQATIERLSGLGISTLGNEDKPKAKMMAGFLFIHRRRTDPTFKWNDAMAFTQADFDNTFTMGDDDTATDDQAAEDADAGPFESEGYSDEP